MKHSLWIIAGLMVAVTMETALADQPVISHNDSFSKEGLLKANVADLKDTQLVGHPDVPLDATKNVLWCGTLQLAWNEAINLVGEKIRFVNQPPLVNLLNQEDFTKADLDPGSYVAIADFERNHVEQEIRDALEKTFHGAASPELIPPKPPRPGPDDFVAYAYLYKNLSFPKPFEENEPIDFGGTKVKNFGFVENKNQLSPDVVRQVSISDFQSDDDFIIQLKTKSDKDELILAKVPPGASLQETITGVLQRVDGKKPIPATKEDMLAVPKLNFDVRRDFDELEGLVLDPGPTAKIKSKLVISKAEQLVRFQLNETGATLKSEAVVVMMAMAAPMPSHQMIFDKPFLILMRQAGAKEPYFALWVGNASLLVPADKP